jgi:hypothetical protein
LKDAAQPACSIEFEHASEMPSDNIQREYPLLQPF